MPAASEPRVARPCRTPGARSASGSPAPCSASAWRSSCAVAWLSFDAETQARFTGSSAAP